MARTRQQRALAYHQALAQVAAAYPVYAQVSLARLFAPLFDLAPPARKGDVTLMAAENRAAILTLALHASGKSWAHPDAGRANLGAGAAAGGDAGRPG